MVDLSISKLKKPRTAAINETETDAEDPNPALGYKSPEKFEEEYQNSQATLLAMA